MKKIVTTFLALITVAGFAFAQSFELVDGIAYNINGTLANGKYTYDLNETQKEVSFVNGIKEGNFNVFAANGNLVETGAFHNNQKHGLWQKWNAEGIKISEVVFDNGVRDGKWTIWDDNGTLRYTMFYNHGQKVGTWLMYDENGTLVKEETYSNSF